MESTPRTSDASDQTRGSSPAFRLYPAALTNDSKAQNILGLSQVELHTARHQSAKPASIQQSFSQQPDQISFHQFFARGKAKSVVPAAKVFHSPSGYLERKELIEQDLNTANRSESARLKRHSSNSTIRSFYDAAKAPLRISQQTSDSASQQFAQKHTSSVENTSNFQAMGQSKALRFFKSSRLRNIAENRSKKNDSFAKRDVELSPTSIHSKPSISSSQSPLATSVSSFSSPTMPTSPQMINSKAEYLEDASPQAEILHPPTTQNVSVSKPILPTPYAKVNVRRPKAGTTNWFDDLGDDLSEEERQVEEEKTTLPRTGSTKRSEYKHQANDDLNGITSHDRVPQNINHTQHLSQPLQIEASQQVIMSTSDVSTLVNTLPIESRPSSKTSMRQSIASDHVNLTQDIVLHGAEMMELHDEESDIVPPLHSLPSPSFVPTIRESIAVDTYGGLDLEIGLAQAVQAAGNLQRNHPTPIKLIKARGIEGTSSAPSKISTAAVIYKHGSIDPGLTQYEYNGPIAKDPEEDALLSSFPATPTDTIKGRRTSWRSSMSFSDDRSIGSMRVMKVTRQEERLIAAMRMKRAAMQEAAEAAAVGRDGPDAAELGDKFRVVPNRASMAEHIAQWNEFTISQITPSARYSGLGIHHDNSERQLGFNSIHALAELDATASPQDDLQPRTPADMEVHDQAKTSSTQRSLNKSRRLFSQRSYETDSRPQSFLSNTTEDSQRYNSNLIVLENLNSGLPAQTLPSQLLVESPFATWERDGSATVH